ncbi:MAG: 4Fe-4S double cluster binding domain-containing protein [Anaerolineae bacterium]
MSPLPLDLASLEDIIKSAGAIWGYADVAGLFSEQAIYPRAISLAMPLPPEALLDVENGPTAAYYEAYCSLNTRLNGLAAEVESILVAAGYPAQAFPATVSHTALQSLGASLNAPIPHKTVATRAGLGWIGKNALLITPQYGPRVRLASVLTQAPVPTALPISAGRCGKCMRCVSACPAYAIQGASWLAGSPREALVDIWACQRKAEELLWQRAALNDTVCGICIAVCPVGAKTKSEPAVVHSY